jgi:hypothetical protein
MCRQQKDLKYPVVKDEGNHRRDHYGDYAPDKTLTQFLEVTEESQPLFSFVHFGFEASPGLAGWLSWLGAIDLFMAGGASPVLPDGVGGGFGASSSSLVTVVVRSEPAFFMARIVFPRVLATSVIFPGPININARIRMSNNSHGPIPNKSMTRLY